MKLKLMMCILAGFIFFGCAVNQNSSSQKISKTNYKIIDTRLTEKSSTKPVLMSTNHTDFFVYYYNGRVYVIGSKKMSEKFASQHHLPYTRTILGEGPKGETVIYEVQKKKPEYVDSLQQKFAGTPALLDQQAKYYVWKYAGRIYVIGKEKTNQAFISNHFLPYTRTVLGAGPQGETVIFEVDKKDASFSEKLKQKFENS